MAEARMYILPLVAHKRCGVDLGPICWGSCGKAFVGAIVLGNGDEALPCNAPAAECPHHERSADAPFGEVEHPSFTGPVYLRRIKAEANRG